MESLCSLKDNNQVSFSPNPFSQTTNLILKGVKQKGDLIIYDNSGKEYIKQQSVNLDGMKLLFENCSPGIYIWKFYNTEFISTGKLIKQ